MGQRSPSGVTPRRPDTSDPSRSRERALRVLFQADLRGVAPTVTLERLERDPAARALLDERDSLTDEVVIVPPPAAETEVVWEAGARSPAAPAGPDASGWSEPPTAVDPPALDGFTRTLVRGVEAHRAAIEELISRYSRRWAIPRMPVVDRNVLRLATYELLHETTPPAVVIDEAIDLAKRLSTDDSGRFVNGVLESIRRDIAEATARADGGDREDRDDDRGDRDGDGDDRGHGDDRGDGER